MRYWEKRRWWFNAFLVPPTILGYIPGEIISAGVGDRPNFGWFGVLVVIGLACVAANACYSVVYIPEFVLMGRRTYHYFARNRDLLFVVGVSFGVVLAYQIAREIYWLQYDPDLFDFT